MIGALVECVDDSKNGREDAYIFPNGWIKKGEVYTISGEAINPTGPKAWIIDECPALWKANKTESGWRKSRFKIIQEPMDISMLIEESINELV